MADLRYGLALSLLVGGCVVRSTLGQLDGEGDTASGSSDADVETSQGGADASGGIEDGDTSGGVEGDSGAEVPPEPDDWVVPEECAEVAAESTYCLTLDHYNAALIGLDTNSVCTFGVLPDDVIPSASFAWQGTEIVLCSDPETAVRIDLLTGAAEELERPCNAVTELGDRLLVSEGPFAGNLEIYDGWDALMADTPTEDLGFDLLGTRMWTDGELLLDAWHATDTLWRHTIAGTQLDDLPLEGHDGWIDGMAVVDGTLLVLTRGDSAEDVLRRFDADTGTSLGTSVLTGLFAPNGLQCRPGEGG